MNGRIRLRNINARISIFHGKATIKTAPGKGFMPEVEVPVKK
jgi:signal transduction histidine kinase